MATIPLSQIPTLTLLYKLHKLSPSPTPRSDSSTAFNDKISLIRTDITKLAIDSIVNAANESLLGGGGVDGAIHRAAGPQLYQECDALRGCDTGSAKITNAYRLPCKKVIHAVGPVYHSSKRKGMHTTLLQGCYTTSLDLAVDNGCRSIAFSALSTGVYGYPSDEAAEAAIAAVQGWLEEDPERAGLIERVIFVVFMEKDERAYEEFLPEFFPPVDDVAGGDEVGRAVDEYEDEGVELAAGEGPAKAEAQPSTDSAEETMTQADVRELPSVPTTEPGEEDAPEAKKHKLNDDDRK